MRTFALLTALLSIALTVETGRAQPAESGHLEVEIEPLAYVLGGAGGHVGYQGSRWSYTLEVFTQTVPPRFHGNERFEAAPLGMELLSSSLTIAHSHHTKILPPHA